MRSIDRIKSPIVFSCGALLAILALGAAPSSALAQSADGKAQVQKLFDEAGKAMDRHDYDEACPKFEKVVILEPAKVGARFALADCYEQAGKIASAAAAYKEAALRAATATDVRVAKAVAKANELSAKAPRLTVRVSDAVRALPGLSIMRNGEPLEVGQWGQPIPADSGVCEISATATGKEPWSGKVTIAAAGVPAQIDVGPFVDSAPVVAAPTPAAPAPPSTAAPASSAAAPPLAPTKDEAPSAATSGGAPKWAYAVGGFGLVSTGVAVAFLVAQSGAQKTFNSDCKGSGSHDADTCASDKSALNRDFGLWLGFGAVGVAALAVSAITIARAPSHASSGAQASMKASFWITPQSSGAGLEGRF